MKILYLSYASEPSKGSEYGVGWNVPLTYARQYPMDDVYVLTRGRVRRKIEKELEVLHLSNLHYLFYDIPSWLTYPNEMQSHWGEQINYILWQLLSRKKVKRIVKQQKIDIVHHLTFNQYRTPSPGFWLDIPFVMGPIGGAETISPCFDRDLSPHTLHKEVMRRKGKDLKLFGWLTKRSSNRKMVFFSSMQNRDRIFPYCSSSCKGDIMPAIAFSSDDFHVLSESNPSQDTPVKAFEMIYAGKALDWKGLHIFLQALKKAFLDHHIKNIRVLLIGIRFEEEQQMVKTWAELLNLQDYVDLVPFMDRNQLLQQMSHCNLSVYPAFRDSGSMSVLEASVLGCPTICFDTGGQDAFPDEILFKVKVQDSYEETLDAFAQRLLWIYNHPDEAKSVGERSKDYVYRTLTWEKRISDFRNVYKKLI